MNNYNSYGKLAVKLSPEEVKENSTCFCCTKGCHEQLKNLDEEDGVFYIEEPKTASPDSKIGKNSVMPITDVRTLYVPGENQIDRKVFYSNKKSAKKKKEVISKSWNKFYTNIIVCLLIGVLLLVLAAIIGIIINIASS